MRFGDIVSHVLPAAFGYHPDFAKIDWPAAQWFKSGQPFSPDFDRSLAENGLGHKDVIRFRTPGLTGIKGSFS
jgi:phenol hydroxylase P4 protein